MSSQILKEYLVAVGFKIDQTQVRRFEGTIGRADVSVGRLATGLLGAAAAAQALVAKFAFSMEKMYYASKRTDATVTNIQALEYAGKQLGLSGGSMLQALESMSRAIRANPGLVGLLNDLGIQVTGRDKSDVLADLVTQLSKMPFYVAQQYGSLFGLNPDDLLMLQQGIDQLQKLREQRKKMNEEAGLDADAAAKAAKEYAQALREVNERLTVMKDLLAVWLLPSFKDAAKELNKFLDYANKLIGLASKAKGGVTGQFADNAKKNWSSYWDFGGKFWSDPMGLWRDYQRLKDERDRKGQAAAPKAQASAGKSSADFAALEQRYGLPGGLLDKMWAKESGRGKYMKSPAGALGHFQFMPKTAAEFGLKDPNDLGQSSEAAARYMSQLLKRYDGDLQKALAAYNWGMGNVDRKGLANAPWETRDYVQTLSGRPIQIQQTNQFTITAPDPNAAARAVVGALDGPNASIVRNLSGAVQ